MKTTELQRPTRSLAELQQESVDATRNAIALNPEMPAAHLVPEIVKDAAPDFLAELDSVLRARHFLSIIRSERLLQRRKEQESFWKSAPIRVAAMKLPSRIPIGGGKTIPRAQMEFAHTTLYLKFMDEQQDQRKENDAKRAAIEAIRKVWPRAKKRPRPMTLAEVDAVRAR